MLLIHKPWKLPRRTESMLQVNQKHRRATVYIDKHILNENKMKRKNLVMAFINYKNAYGMVLQSWILHSLKMHKIPNHFAVKIYEWNLA